MMHLFFLQATDITNSLPCPPKDSSDIVYLISSFLLGGGFTAVVNGFFNVENTKQILTLEGEIKLEKQKNEHLQGELIERDQQIGSLLETNAQLSKERTSGFSNRMNDLEAMVTQLQREKQALLVKLRRNRQPPMSQ